MKNFPEELCGISAVWAVGRGGGGGFCIKIKVLRGILDAFN
jgi:hypothetical protein